ncbi:hypothetical protein C8Q80DRAFT_263908 [Daedaleopsis nitida]|nr:hypothetical protein C8Q80DRAFT_263908 [Daedaleopsis nitida]
MASRDPVRHSIYRLPNEIWAYVLLESYLELAFGAREQPINQRPEREWTRLLAVCGRWRDLILCTPRFWQIINIYDKPDWPLMCLHRAVSLETSVDIYFHGGAYNPYDILSLLQDYLPIIRRLSFRYPETWFKHILKLLDHDMPSLEGLSLMTYTPRDTLPIFILSSSKFPKLQSLLLSSVAPPTRLMQLQSDIYSRLRSLSVSNNGWCITIESFLDMLDTCQNLEELTIRYALWRLIGMAEEPVDPVPQVYRQSPIILPQLRTIVVEDFTNTLPPILRWLHLPVVTTIDIMSNITIFQIPTIVADLDHPVFDKPFSSTLPDDPMFLIPLSRHTSFSYVARGYEFTAVAWSRDEPQRHLELRTHSDSDLEWDVNADVSCSSHGEDDVRHCWYTPLVAKGLRDLIGLLSGAPIVHICLELDFGELSRTDLRALFSGFPLLEKLEMEGSGSVDHVWRVLLPQADNPTIYCPNLKTVTIGGLDEGADEIVASEKLMKYAVAALSARARHGSHLERLWMRLVHPTRSEYEDLRRRYLPLLRRLVARVALTYSYVEDSGSDSEHARDECDTEDQSTDGDDTGDPEAEYDEEKY